MKPKEPTYAEASARLNDILQQLRDGSVEIDDLAQVVEEAAQLLAHCRKKLRGVEAKVERIAAELDETVEDPFDEPAE